MIPGEGDRSGVGQQEERGTKPVPPKSTGEGCSFFVDT